MDSELSNNLLPATTTATKTVKANTSSDENVEAIELQLVTRISEL